MKENEKSFGLFRLVALCVIVLIMMVAPPLVLANVKQNKISGEELWGEKSDFCGVLEIWNVDTFSGAKMSKTDFLNMVARRFENDFKGVFVCVKNMKVDEFKIALSEGRRPNLISFGFGLGNVLKDILDDLGEEFSINENILNSGKVEDEQLAVGYIMNMYGLFAETKRVSINENESLYSVMLKSGEDIEGKKAKRHIYSLNYGRSEFVHPEKVLGLVSDADVYQSMDEYSAYVDYVNFNKSNILLGNMRDLVRLENKVIKGDMLDIIAESVIEYNDLIQYIGLVKDLQVTVLQCSKNFIRYLLSESSQKLIANSGLFCVNGDKLYQEGQMNLFENAIENIKVYPNVFS